MANTRLSARFLSGFAALAVAGAMTLVAGAAPASATATGLAERCQTDYLAYGFSNPHDCIVALNNAHHPKKRR